MNRKRICLDVFSLSSMKVFFVFLFFKLSKSVCWAKFLIMYTSSHLKDKSQPIRYI